MLDARLQETGFDRVMAFDFGTRKMGVAAGQRLTGNGQPLALFPMQDGVPAWPELLKLIASYAPDGCLVGLPLNMDDSESELARRARKFARRLRHQTGLPVWMVDERLTSREAHAIKQEGPTRQAADSVAAALLIAQWYAAPQPLLP